MHDLIASHLYVLTAKRLFEHVRPVLRQPRNTPLARYLNSFEPLVSSESKGEEYYTRY
jgi:hypothetical protein